MINYCLVENGVVVRRTVAREPVVKENPPNGVWVENGEAQVGWSYDGETFTAPPLTPALDPTPTELRNAAFKALPDRADLVTRLKTATPAQIDTWLTNNVTNLAQARNVLGAIIKYLATMNGD